MRYYRCKCIRYWRTRAVCLPDPPAVPFGSVSGGEWCLLRNRQRPHMIIARTWSALHGRTFAPRQCLASSSNLGHFHVSSRALIECSHMGADHLYTVNLVSVYIPYLQIGLLSPIRCDFPIFSAVSHSLSNLFSVSFFLCPSGWHFFHVFFTYGADDECSSEGQTAIYHGYYVFSCSIPFVISIYMLSPNAAMFACLFTQYVFFSYRFSVFSSVYCIYHHFTPSLFFTDSNAVSVQRPGTDCLVVGEAVLWFVVSRLVHSVHQPVFRVPIYSSPESTRNNPQIPPQTWPHLPDARCQIETNRNCLGRAIIADLWLLSNTARFSRNIPPRANQSQAAYRTPTKRKKTSN